MVTNQQNQSAPFANSSLPVGDAPAVPPTGKRARPLFDPPIVRRALGDAFKKLDPRAEAKNPVMFVVWVGSVITTIIFLASFVPSLNVPMGGWERAFTGQIAMWLWFTVLFANFAEAIAEGRGKAQADELRKTRTTTKAKRIGKNGSIEEAAAPDLRKGDIVFCEVGDIIPSDGTIIEGIASVDESAITGESAPVIREAGGDRSAVTGGTKVISDSIKVEITANPGETFIDRMIGLVEGASRQKTPNEIALNILIAGLTIIFLLATVTLLPFAQFNVTQAQAAGMGGTAPSITILIALLVCLIPTTIGGLLSAIGIAGMDRVMQYNVLAMSGKAVEAAGDVDVLLLDKTGTITLGNRQAAEFLPLPGVDIGEMADAAQLSSLADETPEGRSIVVLAKEKYNLRGRHLEEGAEFIPFTAQTRMSGLNMSGVRVRKGAVQAVADYVAQSGGSVPAQLQEIADGISKQGGTPLAVVLNDRPLGIIYLKDIVKGGMRERFDHLRAMGIKTIMITGDNPLTAAAIAQEAGVDDFLAQAKPEDKMALIKKEQAEGRLVAMTGDGTNDAPALAQADVGVAMNSGTQAAKEAGNMVDLDSNPTKLIEIVEIGKQLLMTRGALTTFSISNDVAKYFAIIPAMFSTLYLAAGAQHGPLWALNIMKLHSPYSAVLAAIIFNALIIIALIPVALRGVPYRPMGAAQVLRRNLLVWGLGGIILPFPFIWLLDQIVVLLHCAPAH